MEKSLSNISIRTAWIIISLIISACSIAIPQPLDADSLRQVASLVVTTFSFLAGFLIAAIAVVGYSTEVVARHGWQVAVHYRKSFKTRLERYAAHFVLYLLAIIIVISWSYIKIPIPKWFWYVSCLICTFALLMAFSLPYEIIMQHISMYDAVIEKEKEKDAKQDALKYGNTEDSP